MDQTIIIINAEIQEEGKIVPISPATETMVNSLQKAIKNSGTETKVEIVAGASLWSKSLSLQEKGTIYCPLTIELPESFQFPAQEVFQRCRDIVELRHWVSSKLGYRTTTEHWELQDFWLPIILSDKGPVYGEVIGEGVIPYSCEQPIDLPDKERQSLYQLGYKLLQELEAPSAVYLLQFSIQHGEIIFNRLWPFPAAPALASLRVQQPDLYTCHWYCLTNQPIPEVIVQLLH